MRQPKQKRECPKCGGILKRTIGAFSRRKYWICAEGGEDCYRSRYESGPVPS